MKKIIPILAILMFVLSALALADPPVPKPIRGYFDINGKSVAGYVIEVQNLRTGEIITGNQFEQLRTQSGGFAFDLSMFKQGYAGPIEKFYVGDEIEVRVEGFGDTGKVRFNVPSSTPYYVTVSIGVSAEKETEYIFVCWDGSRVKGSEICPIKPTVTKEPEVITKYLCEDGTEVAKLEDCPKTPIIPEDYLLETFIAIIALVLGVLGYKYKWLKGFVKIWEAKVAKADTPEKKKKAIESGTKAIKTVLTKDKENKYKK